MIKKKPFINYDLKENDNKPISVKLNDEDKEMLSIGAYVFNMHSKGGILKELAHIGVKVILRDIGADKMHRLTRGDRVRLIQQKPKCLEKVNPNY